MSASSVYITDLDGTLLQPDARLSDYARESILKLLDSRIPFTVATARSVTSTREILGDIPFKLPVVCSNGGCVYEYDSVRALHVEYLQQHFVREILETIAARKDTAFVSVNEEGSERVFYDSLPNEGMQWYHDDRVAARDERLTFVNDIRECADMRVTTITFMNRFHHIDRTQRFFHKNYGTRIRLNYFENKYSPGWHWMSLHSSRATKAGAIARLHDIAGLNGSRTVVFGDEMNDLSMFATADHAVAVGNALPPVKEAADEIIGESSEDAVIRYILEANKLA